MAEGAEGAEGTRGNAPLSGEDFLGKDLEILDGNSQGNVNISQNEGSKTSTEPLASSLDPSDPSVLSGTNKEPLLLRCYYCAKSGNGNAKAKAKGRPSKIFETHDEREYLRHGNLRHYNKPMYPNNATIEKHNLIPQGKSWEK
jgi:hypothetical protein